MKENGKYGFTLIEVLAVIVILAIIALIATPIVLNIVKDVKKSAFMQTTNGIIGAVEYYHANEVLNVEKTKEDIILTLPEDVDKLEFDGEVPQSGEIKIYKDGPIILAISNGNYCVRKFKGETELQISEKVDNCILPVTLKDLATTSEDHGITSVDNCVSSGVCQSGTAFAIRVNDEEVKKFL